MVLSFKTLNLASADVASILIIVAVIVVYSYAPLELQYLHFWRKTLYVLWFKNDSFNDQKKNHVLNEHELKVIALVYDKIYVGI